MFQPSITISLLSAGTTAPFVLGPNLEASLAAAADYGFPACELFPPDLEAIDVPRLGQLLDRYGIRLSTIGTGGGWVSRRWSLLDPDPEIQQQAMDYIAGVIDRAADLGAAAIIGSMQGRHGQREVGPCLEQLRGRLNELAQRAQQRGQPLFYEPLNRYETDLLCSVVNTAEFLRQGGHPNLKILADLFHMNIEEENSAAALRHVGDRLGHVHFVDSNRRAPGMGQTDFGPIFQVLQEIGYTGYLAIEAFPLPDPETAARQALATFRRYQPAGGDTSRDASRVGE